MNNDEAALDMGPIGREIWEGELEKREEALARAREAFEKHREPARADLTQDEDYKATTSDAFLGRFNEVMDGVLAVSPEAIAEARKVLEQAGYDVEVVEAPETTCLTRAQALVDGPRQAAYGPPSENHGCTVALWNAYLRRRGVLREDLTTRDVCWLMVLMKVSRDAHTPKQDNLDDVCGWTRNAEIVTKEAA